MKRLFVVLLLPWWLLLLLLPFVLAVWALIAMFYLCAGILALTMVVTRALVIRHEAKNARRAVRAPAVTPTVTPAVTPGVTPGVRSSATLPTEPAVLAEAVPPTEDVAIATPPAAPPPVLPVEQKRQIAYDLLSEVDPDRFVLVVHDLFSALGFIAVSVVPGRPILTMADPSMELIVVRCIPFTAGTEVGPTILLDALGLRTEFGTPRLAVVSMVPFTLEAEQLAARDQISLYGPTRILDLVDRAGWLQGSDPA